MKQAEVKVGEEYMTKSGDKLIRVRVITTTTQAVRQRFGGSLLTTGARRTVFRVVNVETGRELPKPRTAAALRCAYSRSASEAFTAELVVLNETIRRARTGGAFDYAVMVEDLRIGLLRGRGHGRTYRQALSRIVREGEPVPT
jgi:hypothetical protein